MVEDLIHQYYPNIQKIYSEIPVPPVCNKFAGLFAVAVINKLVQTKIHKDRSDINSVMGVPCRNMDPKVTTVQKTKSQSKDKDKSSIVESNG